MDLAKYKSLFVSETREYLESMSKQILKLIESPSADLYNDLFRSAHSIKGMAASMGYVALRDVSHEMENLLDELRKQNLSIEDDIATLFFNGLDVMESMVEEIDRTGSTHLKADSFKRAREALVVTLSKKEKAAGSDALSPGDRPELEVITPVRVEKTEAAPAEEMDTTSRVQEVFKISSVRIHTRMVDRVVENVAELMLLNAQLQESFPDDPDVARLQSLTRKLYDGATDLLMLPFETLSAGFPRILYDLSKRLQKRIQLMVEGFNIQMDKSILEELADPLIHLLRNAVDHGIETPPLRKAQGKNEVGTITISIDRQGDRILIRLEDDGKGIDPQMIRKTAIKKGFIGEEAASFLNQQEILMLITHPGFSTVGEISDISGRGFGLDVVRSRIHSLGGMLKIYSTPGQFTRFDIMIPFTVAVIPAILVRSTSLTYAIPLTRVDQFLMIYKKDIHYTRGRPVVFYDNRTLYVENLASLLSGNSDPDFPVEFQAFVTEHQNRRIAWAVEELLTEKQIMLRSLGDPLNLIPCYSGATVLGKGEVVPVLDMEQLYRERYS